METIYEQGEVMDHLTIAVVGLRGTFMGAIEAHQWGGAS